MKKKWYLQSVETTGDGVKVERKETELSREEDNQYFKCHDSKNEQHGVENMIVKTSDPMVVPNGKMEQGKQHTIMEIPMSDNARLQSKEKKIEQQEGWHGKKQKVDNPNGIDLWKKGIEAGEWQVDGRENLMVEDEEENPTREENQEGHQGLLVEPRETNVGPSGDDNHVKENHEEFSVEPREHADMGVRNVFETIQVEMKEKGGEKDAKDGNEYQIGEEENRKHDFKGGENCLIRDPEVWMEDENIFVVYLLHEKKRHSIKRSKRRETHGEREDQSMSGELENQHVPKIVREAASRFKQKANE